VIIRFFQVRVLTNLIDEFEPKFKSISYDSVASAKGCSEVQILRGLDGQSQTYVMVSKWESLEALKSFAGPEWQCPHIPAGMEKYAEDCSVEHFQTL